MNLNITQILRPIRLAFLIQPNKKNKYLRAIRACSSLWGGQYFPILPIYIKFTHEFRLEYSLIESPTDFYSKSIENFDPDYVISDESISSTFINKIKGDRISIPLKELEESILSGESKYGISIEDILVSLKETDFVYERNDSRKIVLPIVPQNDLLTATLFGSIEKKRINKIKEIPFPKKYISFPRVTQKNISIFSSESVLYYFKVLNQNIFPAGNVFWTSQTAVFIIDLNRLNDLINYWNLRALGWHVIAIPHDRYKQDYYINLIKLHQKEFNKRGHLIDNISILMGKNIDKETANKISVYFNSIQTIPDKTISYVQHWWLPRFWMDRKYLNYDKSASVLLRSEVKKHTLKISEEKISIPVLYPKFGAKYIRHIAPRFVNEVIYEFDDLEAKYAKIIPAISSAELSIAIKGSGFNQWRFSDNGMFFLSKSNDEYLNFIIPKASEIFEKWFKEKGYNIQYSAVGKLGNQLLRNIGGTYGTNFFSTPGILPVLSLFENGKTVNKRTLFGQLSKQKEHFRDPQLKNVVARLIENNIIQFGVELQCTLCNQHSFYSLTEFQEIVKCKVCYNKFAPPTHNPDSIKWAYRGIGPFSRNNKSEGIVSVLLTLRFFRIALHTDSITPILNFEILKENQVINEVDFAVFYKKFKSGFSTPDLFLCECKTEIDFAKKDIDRMEKLAKLFPKSILVFATLKYKLSNNEKDLITSLAKRTRKGLGSRPINPILILTGNELLSWLFYDNKIKHLIIPHMQFADEIGHLCDITTQHYLGLPSYSSEVEKIFEAKRKKQNDINTE